MYRLRHFAIRFDGPAPRAGGDVPAAWFRMPVRYIPLPAQAGMYRGPRSPRRCPSTAPRAGGDVPAWPRSARWLVDRSPRRRGCTAMSWLGDFPSGPLPAQAGMYRRGRPRARALPTAPRAGGDVPMTVADVLRRIDRSPRRRGCTASILVLTLRRHPLPAQAGMYRRYYLQTIRDTPLPAQAGMYRPRPTTRHSPRTAPRAGGDVPGSVITSMTISSRSPRRRGCTAHDLDEFAAGRPLPAQAGMYRRSPRRSSRLTTAPRAGGDVP